MHCNTIYYTCYTIENSKKTTPKYNKDNLQLKNNSIISFLFGLLMLTAMAHQVLEHVIRLTIEDDTTELVELHEDVEEEQENENKLIEIEGFRFEKPIKVTEISFVNIPNEMLNLNVHRKIPVPPPEHV